MRQKYEAPDRHKHSAGHFAALCLTSFLNSPTFLKSKSLISGPRVGGGGSGGVLAVPEQRREETSVAPVAAARTPDRLHALALGASRLIL